MKYLLVCSFLYASALSFAQSPLELLKDINTAPKHSGNNVIRIAGNEGRIFFAGNGLWRSDGSTNGTSPVYDVINTDVPLDPAKLQVTDQLVFFEGSTSSASTGIGLQYLLPFKGSLAF